MPLNPTHGSTPSLQPFRIFTRLGVLLKELASKEVLSVPPVRIGDSNVQNANGFFGQETLRFESFLNGLIHFSWTVSTTSKLGLPCSHQSRPPFVTKGTRKELGSSTRCTGSHQKRERAEPSTAERGTSTFTCTRNGGGRLSGRGILAGPKAVRTWLLGLSRHQFVIAVEYMIRSVE